MVGFLRRRRLQALPFKGCISVMGTLAYQEVYGINGEEAAEIAWAELHRLDALWSPYRPGNAVDAIRESAGQEAIRVDPDTLQVLKSAKELGLLSGGAFDVTADPLVRLWREAACRKQPPPSKEISALLPLVRLRDFEIDPGGLVALPRRGQGLDLGGIGKGYAADRVRSIYREAGLRHGVINIGGHVLVMNRKPDGSRWRIGIRNPEDPQKLVGCIEAEDCSVVSSGGYEKFFEFRDPVRGPRHFHHILDPRTGWPVDSGLTGVTVVSASSTRADVLATAVFVLGAKQGMALCNSFPDTHVLMLDSQGRVHMSRGMSDLFSGW